MPILRSFAPTQALIELFHQAPGTEQIRRGVAKQLSVRHELLRADSSTTLPTFWILRSPPVLRQS
jgi:hypothetical protein